MMRSSIPDINDGMENGIRANSHLRTFAEYNHEQSRYFQDLTANLPLSVASALAMENHRIKNEETQLRIPR